MERHARALIAAVTALCLTGTAAAQAGAWTATRNLEGPFAAGSVPEPPLVSMNAAGPVAVALGNSEAAAIACTTTATRHVPSKLLVSLRPAGGSFGAAVEPAAGAVAGAMKLGIACDGSVTLVWGSATGI